MRSSRSPRSPSPPRFSGSSSARRSARGSSPFRPGERWSEQPTPTFGGVGIFAGFAAGIAVALASGIIEWSGELGGILAGVTIVFVAGLVDDLWHLSPIAKLAAQITAAVVVLASGLNVEVVGNDVIAWAIGLLWLVGITNAFNLLDNMDGLAATLAIVSCAYFAIDALTAHENETILALSIALGLACGGFLPFNLGRSAEPRCSWATPGAW